MVTLSVEQTAVLERLRELLERRCFVLAGGSGLGLLLGHRISLDLDFFSSEVFAPEQLLAELREVVSVQRIMQMARGTLTVQADGAKLSFFHHVATELAKPLDVAGIQVAAIDDLAAMKLLAIAGRGARKDFVDLYMLCSGPTSLPGALDAFDRKYRDQGYDRYHLLRSLTFFRDAEQDPMPAFTSPLRWEEVRAFFERQVPPLLLG